MKRITKEELPEILTEDIINILVEMALENPKRTFDWANVSELLEQRGQLKVILDKVRIIKRAIERAAEDAKSDEQKYLEAEHNKISYENLEPNKFNGNMGQPNGIYDYKDRYGVWPPGIDDSIAPLNLKNKLDQEQITKIANLYILHRKNVQWKEVYNGLKNNKIDFSLIFNKVFEINNKIFPLDMTIEEFKEMYGTYPPGYN